MILTEEDALKKRNYLILNKRPIVGMFFSYIDFFMYICKLILEYYYLIIRV